MFKVSKRCAYLRALQRTNFLGHTVSQSFFIAEKTKKLKIEVSEPWKPIEYSKLLFILVKTLSLQRPLKFFLGVKYIC